MYKNYPVVLNYTENDYNGLVWGQEAKPAANKSEYIREGYALRKSLKGLIMKDKKQKKKENQKELEQCTTSIACVSYKPD